MFNVDLAMAAVILSELLKHWLALAVLKCTLKSMFISLLSFASCVAVSVLGHLFPPERLHKHLNDAFMSSMDLGKAAARFREIIKRGK